MEEMEKLSEVLTYPKAWKVTAGVATGYFLLYLWLIGDINHVPGAFSGPSVELVQDWPSRIFRAKISFNYEAVGTVYLTDSLALLVSPMNMFLGGVLAVLIGLNVGFLAYALEKPKKCGVASKSGILASVPGLFMGFACCAPTVLIALGSAAASISFGFIAVRSAFYPLAFFGLLASLWYNLNRMETEV